MWSSDRAQSEMVGNILLVGVVVIVATTASIGIVLNLTDGGPSREPTPQADFTVDVTDTEITIGHNGGDSLEASKIRLRVRTKSGEREFRMDSPNITRGNGDTVFEAGEQFQREHNLTGSEFEVRIILEGQQRSRISQESIERPPSASETPTPSTPANQPPSAAFSFSPDSPTAGQNVTFDAGSSSDPDGSVTSYEWDWTSDGTYEDSGETASHSFPSAGDYDVTLRVTDDDGETDTTTQTVTVENAEPTASFTESCTGPECSFDASASSDPDGSIVSYEWDWTDDGSFEDSGQTATHEFPNEGTYDVTLRVTDNDGATDSTTRTITVGPNASLLVVPDSGSAPLTVDGLGLVDREPSTAFVNFSNYTLDGFDSQDNTPNAVTVEDNGRTLSMANNTWKRIDFDYQVSSDTVLAFDFRSGARGEIHGIGFEEDNSQTADRIYRVYGTQNWGRSAYDNYSQSAPDWQRYRIPVGEDYTIGAQYLVFVTDDDDDADAESSFRDVLVYEDDTDVYAYEWDFDGDGVTDATAKQPSYTYSSGGTYTVTLNVTGSAGTTTTLTRTVTVTVDESPTAQFSYTPSAPEAGEQVSFDGSASSDPDGGAIQSYEWDFDGDSVTDATGPTPNYTFGDEGTYDVTLTVTDDKGTTNSTTRTVTVNNAEPTASLSTNPADPTTRTAVQFNASGSTDDGSISTYQFDFGDGRTVTTASPTVEYGYDCADTYTVTLTVTDDDGATNTTTQTVTVDNASRDVVAAITAGGSAYTSCEGIDYEADTNSNPHPTLDTGGSTYSVSRTIAGTADDALYQSERYDTGGTISYGIPVSNGTYNVTLKFAEIYFGNGGPGSSGNRIFDAIVEGTTVRQDLDIYDEVGPDTRLDLTQQVTVTDGYLNVSLTNTEANNPKLSALLVEKAAVEQTWASESDWDSAVSSQRVVHEDAGSRAAGAVQLGYTAGTSSLLTYYPFDTQNGGSAPDASGNGHEAVSNGPSPEQGGVVGTSSYAFNGSEAFLEDGDAGNYLNGLDEVTISYWAQWDQSTPTDAGVLTGSQPDGNDNPFSVRYDESGYEGGCSSCVKTGFSIDSQESVTETGSNVQTNNWQHVVVTWSDGNAPTVYLNGTNSSSFREPQSGAISDVQTLLIGQGAKDQGNDDGWSGQVDELRIYDRTLSAAEASDLYETASSGTLTTGEKTFDTAIDPTTLDVTNLTVTRPAGTAIDIIVESDPDGDGNFEETSDTITLDGSESYDVTGLSTTSKTYRLRVDLSTTSVASSPVVDGVSIKRP
ncbi:MAG: PKD domain-containing protein [Haloarculaceae archaeon]